MFLQNYKNNNYNSSFQQQSILYPNLQSSSRSQMKNKICFYKDIDVQCQIWQKRDKNLGFFKQNKNLNVISPVFSCFINGTVCYQASIMNTNKNNKKNVIYNHKQRSNHQDHYQKRQQELHKKYYQQQNQSHNNQNQYNTRKNQNRFSNKQDYLQQNLKNITQIKHQNNYMQPRQFEYGEAHQNQNPNYPKYLTQPYHQRAQENSQQTFFQQSSFGDQINKNQNKRKNNPKQEYNQLKNMLQMTDFNEPRIQKSQKEVKSKKQVLSKNKSNASLKDKQQIRKKKKQKDEKVQQEIQQSQEYPQKSKKIQKKVSKNEQIIPFKQIQLIQKMMPQQSNPKNIYVINIQNGGNWMKQIDVITEHVVNSIFGVWILQAFKEKNLLTLEQICTNFKYDSDSKNNYFPVKERRFLLYFILKILNKSNDVNSYLNKKISDKKIPKEIKLWQQLNPLLTYNSSVQKLGQKTSSQVKFNENDLRRIVEQYDNSKNFKKGDRQTAMSFIKQIITLVKKCKKQETQFFSFNETNIFEDVIIDLE